MHTQQQRYALSVELWALLYVRHTRDLHPLHNLYTTLSNTVHM